MHRKFNLSYRKERAGVRIILLDHCKEVIMTRSDPIAHSPNNVIQPALEQWFLQLLEDEANHLRPPSGIRRVHPSWRPKIRLGEFALHLHELADKGCNFLRSFAYWELLLH